MSDLFRFAQLQPYYLSGAGAITGDTTITLKSMLDIDGTALTMSGTFGDIGFGTLEPGNGDQEEQICFTGLSNNANGTVTLTGVKNVSFVYPYTQTSGLSKTHPGSSVFVISNTSGFYDKLTSKSDDETITGTWSFSAVPNTTQDPVSGDDIARRSWVLSVVNGGAVSTDKVVISGTAGETLVAGNLIYLKSSDQRWWKCDADTASTVQNVPIGIAQGAGTAGVAITSGVLIKGVDANQSGLTPGSTYYASNTAGGLSSTPGTTSQAVGVAITATTFYLDTYVADIPTDAQKAALAGLEGTPSSTNKYATATSLQKQTATFAADAQGSDTYVVTLSPVPAAYTTGMMVTFTANTANTGAATLNVNSLGPITIKKFKNVDLATGDIKAGQAVAVVYDGTNFQMVSAPSTQVKLYTDDLVTVTNQTETALASVTIPANLLGPTGGVRFKAYVTEITDGTLTVRCKFGATTLITDTWTTVNTTGKKGVIEFQLLNVSATNSQSGVYYKSITQQGNDSIDLREDFKIDTGTSAIDTTADATLAVTVQWTDAGDTFTAYGITVESIT